jgi:hypothetical protein
LAICATGLTAAIRSADWRCIPGTTRPDRGGPPTPEAPRPHATRKIAERWRETPSECPPSLPPCLAPAGGARRVRGTIAPPASLGQEDSGRGSGAMGGASFVSLRRRPSPAWRRPRAVTRSATARFSSSYPAPGSSMLLIEVDTSREAVGHPGPLSHPGKSDGHTPRASAAAYVKA